MHSFIITIKTSGEMYHGVNEDGHQTIREKNEDHHRGIGRIYQVLY